MAFWQYEFVIVGKVGAILPTTVMFKKPGAEQVPADDGVNLYVAVPMTDVLILTGFQVPAIPSFDMSGSRGAVEFWQSGPMTSNVGVITALTFSTIIFDVADPPPHGPLAVTTQLTASLSAKLLPLNTGLFVPTCWPFNSH
jgi:hypothetical protein